MKIMVYTNPSFIRNGEHGKIMFRIENLGYFGVFINGQTGKIEKQAYEWKNFHWKNITGNCVNYQVFCRSHSGLKAIWSKLSINHKEKIFLASMKANEAFKYFIKKYDSQINDFASNNNLTSLQVVEYINDYVWNYIKFVSTLHEGHDFNIDPKYEKGVFPVENTVPDEPVKENITETAVNTRKSVAMFKMMNASNFSNLFEGNIYPITKAKDGYYTVKDNNGNEYTVRANRGKEIKVYIDCPA